MTKMKKLGIARVVERAIWEAADHRKGVRVSMRRALFEGLADMSDTHMQAKPPVETLSYRPPGAFMPGSDLPDVPADKALSGDEPWEFVEVRLSLAIKEID